MLKHQMASFIILTYSSGVQFIQVIYSVLYSLNNWSLKPFIFVSMSIGSLSSEEAFRKQRNNEKQHDYFMLKIH